ncbi:pyruvate dehydrogenase [Hahella sp. CCB-MM4]|uniref:alpha-ketoacid dehydrogenase subunit beta n=1 Tax=Hahella sp. (strain CCB-MM4) TaxID=1926491 RepID=UPI000B9B4900|nr:transketolase C-terminal domain-containing protein [Hahella sp. CCB-MM4]OZG72994.1 pyruvate dehydrogenase [Hahella sp. CCB-MM4]
MIELSLGQAIDRAIENAMSEDESIVLIGEDVPMLRAPLYARFGVERVMGAPISESAFIGAAVGAAMEGLRPIVELYMVDFLAVAFDAVLNHMAKLEAFSGGEWHCPVLIRAPSGGGYGDGGQHAQSLWGMLSAIPGLTTIIPSTPMDAYGLTRTALRHSGPVILFEPKLLSEEWLEFLGRLGREDLEFDVPENASGMVNEDEFAPFGRAVTRREGGDVTILSLAVGVHRALAAAEALASDNIQCEVIDLRCLSPLDRESIRRSVAKTGRMVVVDEDYRNYGLSGELAATVLEAGLHPTFVRVCVEGTIPYNHRLEKDTLPSVKRIIEAVKEICQS